jgi:hypothetical protein|uniref:hypothetical protein n=1 Tax=Cephaloticoccus sp. TaxID=1985742 RepID=UPI00404AE55A
MANSIPPGFNRALYGMFLLFAVYQCWTHTDYTSAASSVGIALVFDPFNQQQPWNQRPGWQKAWLVGHPAVAAGLFGLGLGLADRL